MTTASPLTTLRDEQQLLSSLVELMKQEQQFLVRADTEGLTALTPQKSRLVHQMGQLAAQRHQALGGAGFAVAEAGMEAWLASGAEAGASVLWQQLLALTREAKELNRVNGMLINKQMMHTQVQINAMRTPAHGSDTGFYGPSGQTTPRGPSRGFVAG
jgi:flagella synthesis protein FlgN